MTHSLPKFRKFPIHCQESSPFGEGRATSCTDDLSASKDIGRGQRPRIESARERLPFVFVLPIPNAIKCTVEDPA